MNIGDIRGFIRSPFDFARTIVARKADYQKEILRVMSVLPGKYRYAQVAAAIHAAGVAPNGVYMDLSAGERTIVLARFYEALEGSGYTGR